MKKLLSLCVPLLFLAFAHSAYGQQTNVCGTTTVTPGGTFTWGSTYAVPIRVEPAPGTTWFLGQTYVEIPPHGQVTVTCPRIWLPGVGICKRPLTFRAAATHAGTSLERRASRTQARPKIRRAESRPPFGFSFKTSFYATSLCIVGGFCTCGRPGLGPPGFHMVVGFSVKFQFVGARFTIAAV